MLVRPPDDGHTTVSFARSDHGSTPRRANPHVAGLVLASASGLSFSVSTVVGQAALEFGMTSAAAAGIRLLVGAAMLWVVALMTRTFGVGGAKVIRLLATGTLTSLQVLLLFEAIDRLGSSLAILLLYSYPSIVAVISVVSGRERLSTPKVVGIALSLVGTLLVIGGTGGSVTTAGLAFGLGSGLALALYITAADRTSKGMTPLAATAWIQLGAAVAITPVVLSRGGFGGGDTPWWSIWIGVASGTAALLFIMAVSRVTPTIASVSSTVEPICTAILATLFLDDSLSGRQLLGGVLIVSAVLTVSRRPRARPRPDLAESGDRSEP